VFSPNNFALEARIITIKVAPDRSKAMKKAKLLYNLLIVSILLVVTQVFGVSAAVSLDNADTIFGTIQGITLETDLNTG
jgi:hypothetical protein